MEGRPTLRGNLRSAPVKTLYVLKTGEPLPSVLAEKGDFVAWIEGVIGPLWSGSYATVDVRTGEAPPFDGGAYVITGSSANVPNREPWMLAFEGWLREAVAMKLPIFGICFGHQILAQALGGEVQKNPRGREMGTVRVERFVDDPIFDGMPSSFEANATHVDTVVRLPEGAVAMARNELEDHHVIRFTNTCYGAQFHPEVDASIMKSYIDARREILAGEGSDPSAMIEGVTEAEFGRRVLQNFARHIVPR